MIKYYVANANKTKFAYITTVPMWSPNGGKTKLVYNNKKIHLFSLERAKRVLLQCKKYNLTEYQLFSTEISY